MYASLLLPPLTPPGSGVRGASGEGGAGMDPGGMGPPPPPSVAMGAAPSGVAGHDGPAGWGGVLPGLGCMPSSEPKKVGSTDSSTASTRSSSMHSHPVGLLTRQT